jgi:predicted RNase H-like HicB family nuclease
MPDRAVSYRVRNPSQGGSLTFTVELEQESDGHWIGEVPQLPGTLVYGATPEEATARAKALALRVLADRLEHGEADAALDDITFAAA